MKTLQECKDEVHQHPDWESGKMSDVKAWTEAAELYAQQFKDEATKLQAFKDYVHKRLDDAGVPIDPESPHKEKGCRIGGRLDVVLEEKAKLIEENQNLIQAISDIRQRT